MPNETDRVIDPLPARPSTDGVGAAPLPAATATPAGATANRSGPTPTEPITLRIVSLDYYMAPPIPGMDVCWSELEGLATQKVPVIRIFGATPGGQKSCLHLHGIFPYFYIPYEDDMPQDTSGAMAYARRVALSLDAALSFSNASGPPGGAPGAGRGGGDNNHHPSETAAGGGRAGGPSSSRRQRVFGAMLVRGIPFYGYHPGERPFIKLILYDPKDVKKAASLLLAGAVFGRSFQPHESHVPYLLQFKIDLNLQGMGYLTLSKGMFRGKLPAEPAGHRQGWAQREIFQTEDGDDEHDIHNGLVPAAAGAVPSPGTSGSPSSTSSALLISSKIWLESTVPATMRWGSSSTERNGNNATGGPALPVSSLRASQRQTTCDLEFDGHAEDVLNRKLLVRLPLAQASPEIRMVESLAPMWEEERMRCGGAVPPPPPDVPRTPQQLSSAVSQCREEFQSIENQIKQALGIESIVSGGDKIPDKVLPNNISTNIIEEMAARNASQLQSTGLLHATQAANQAAAAVFAPSQALPSADQPPQTAAAAVGNIRAAEFEAGEQQNPVDYGQYIDEAILTQMSVEEEEHLPVGRPPSAAAGVVFPIEEEVEELFARQHGDGLEGEEEDLLLALAMQLTPASLPPFDPNRILHPPQAAAAAMETTPAGEAAALPGSSQVPFLNFPGLNSQQADTYRRAQSALEQFLAATQQECEDILECSAPQQPPPQQRQQDQQLDNSEMKNNSDLDLDNNNDTKNDNTSNDGEEERQAQQPQQRQETSFIPQVDGGFDDDPPPPTDTSHAQKEDKEKYKVDEMQIDEAIEAEAAEVPPVVHRPPSREAYVPRDRVRASGQFLSASMRFLAASEEEEEAGDFGVEEKPDAVETGDASVLVGQQQEKNATSGDFVLSQDLPPTQPLSNIEAEEEEEEDHEQEQRREDAMDVENPHLDIPPLRLDPGAYNLNNGGVHNRGDWWREEASQIPFEDLEWDLLDDDVGGGIPEDDEDGENDIIVDDDDLIVRQLVAHRYRQPAPSESHLLSSGWDQGILPIVHQGAHYSNRVHVPTRAPIFAGKEFRVPCTAATDLPMFGSGVMEKARSNNKQKENKVGLSRGLIAFTPVRKPPSRVETDAWLAARFVVSRENNGNNKRINGGAGAGGGGGVGGKRNGSGAGFTMDPNTGKLVPTGQRERGTAGGASADTSQPLSSGGGGGGGSAGDLLGTPSLASIPSSDPRKRLKSNFQQQVYSTPDIEMLGGVKSSLGGSGGGDGGGSGKVGSESKRGGDDLEDVDRDQLRPPSPKYDEASFFYNNPFISDAAPSIRGGGGSMSGRSRLSTQGRKGVAVAGTSPALGSNNLSGPAPAGQHQQQQKNHGQPTMSPRKSVLKPPQQQQQAALGPSQGSKDAIGRAGEIKPVKKTVAFTPEDDIVALKPAEGAELPAAAVAPSSVKAKAKPKPRSQFVSQITPPSFGGGRTATPSSQLGFKRIVSGKGQGLTLASIEVHADCRGQLLPDPRYDAVRVVVIAVTDDEEDVPDGNFFARIFIFDGELGTAPPAGAADAGAGDPSAAANTAINNPSLQEISQFKLSTTLDGITGCQIERFPTEAALFDAVVAAVCALDPDIILGYEIQKESLGYLSDRAAVAFQRTTLLKELSRMPGNGKQGPQDKQQQDQQPGGGTSDDGGGGTAGGAKDQYGWDHASGLDISGRIVLNVWRLMRGELKLNIYTLENCAAAVLRLRVPHIPAPQLAAWFSAGPSGGRWRCLSHLILRARLSLALLDRLDLVGRTSEMARTFGIDFFSVLSRGSQYRVESMTLRLAHSQNYVAVAPSPEQVARQPAMEALPLVMEPRSALYPDPVCVLDFQSLYPSMIIAYNLCYSTCIGRPAHAAAAAAAAEDGSSSPAASSYKVKLGCSEYVTPLQALSGGKPGAEGLVIAPNGVAFVPPAVRPGVLPRLLNEILSTRIMVKAAMKRAPSSLRVLLRCLNARQFGLKLIANVTYGYTAAGFSGRMPMAELADAIVQSGRATLEAAISMVENHPTWKAKVVYGDTDSLFVQLPGRTVEEAFAIGAEIAAAVTAANPPPVTLKLEKVYRPCVLLSKKRYVGAMYESPNQKVPTFDAKGIETVRRDACPAVAKMMEKTLRLLFASGDLSAVRLYLEKQWTRILSGRVSISDFIFAKEVRLGTYSARAAVVPPAALVATRAMAADPRAEPRYGERVPYVVVYGEPGARLSDMVVPPRALVESGGRLRLHAVYYITKQIIPSIERALSLVGADVRAWFAAMPRPQRTLPQKRPQESLPLLPDASRGNNNGGGINGAGGGAVARATTNSYALGGGGGALTIDRFYLSRHCAVCDELTHASKPLCERCLTEPQLAAAVLSSRCNRLGRQYSHLLRVCGACGGGGGTSHVEEGGIVCDSLDCGVYFERRKVWRELQAGAALAEAGLKALEPV